MSNKNCDHCGRSINDGEPYTSFDFVTQRVNDDGSLSLLEGREMTAQCLSCGYARYDEVALYLLGVSAAETSPTFG